MVKFGMGFLLLLVLSLSILVSTADEGKKAYQDLFLFILTFVGFFVLLHIFS